MAKTIGVVSLKGGVGKTSIVTSLGAALSKLGQRVLLVDGNLSSPTLGLHLNVIEPKKTLHDVLNRGSRVLDAIHTSEGLDILPASIFTNQKVNPLKLKDVLKGVKRKYDFILLDSSPSLDEETLAVMLASDELFVVTTPDHPTVSASLKAAKLAKQRGAQISGLIINKVHGKNFELGFDSVQDTLEIPVLAVVPYDQNILRALSVMQPYTDFKPHAKGSEEMMKLAALISGQKYQGSLFREFLNGFTPSRTDINRELFYQSIFKE